MPLVRVLIEERGLRESNGFWEKETGDREDYISRIERKDRVRKEGKPD